MTCRFMLSRTYHIQNFNNTPRKKHPFHITNIYVGFHDSKLEFVSLEYDILFTHKAPRKTTKLHLQNKGKTISSTSIVLKIQRLDGISKTEDPDETAHSVCKTNFWCFRIKPSMCIKLREISRTPETGKN